MNIKISRAFELAFKVYRANVSVTFSSKMANFDFFFGLFLQNVSLIMKIC